MRLVLVFLACWTATAVVVVPLLGSRLRVMSDAIDEPSPGHPRGVRARAG